jgi:hypothetical protein
MINGYTLNGLKTCLDKWAQFRVAGAFKVLKNSYVARESKAKTEFNILRDYFTTHPTLDLRIEKFESKGTVWYKANKSAMRYSGKQNIDKKISYYKKEYDDEWLRPKLP